MRTIKLVYLATCEQDWVWQMESGERARAHERCVLLFDTCMLVCSVKQAAAAAAASEPSGEPHLARLAQLLSTSSTIITPLVLKSKLTLKCIIPVRGGYSSCNQFVEAHQNSN